MHSLEDNFPRRFSKDIAMNKNKQLLVLMAKTGVFFAKADGQVDERERKAVSAFLENMNDEMDLMENIQVLTDRYMAQDLTLDDIVGETNAYFEGYNDFERKSLLNSIAQFIETVISADGIRTLEEKQFYLGWQQRLGMVTIDVSKYQQNYSEDDFWRKLGKCAKKAGLKVVYSALLLYYVSTDKSVPANIKVAIFGALGYLILPMDLLPDFIPAIGFTDDLGALLAVYSLVKGHVTPEVEKKAKAKLSDWFGVFDEKDLVL